MSSIIESKQPRVAHNQEALIIQKSESAFDKLTKIVNEFYTLDCLSIQKEWKMSFFAVQEIERLHTFQMCEHCTHNWLEHQCIFVPFRTNIVACEKCSLCWLITMSNIMPDMLRRDNSQEMCEYAESIRQVYLVITTALTTIKKCLKIMSETMMIE